jgi:Zn-dependent M28 family amino/carboxypeptidase
LEGNEKKNEIVVISAHYDHLGKKSSGTGDLIYNGANDNASGVAAMIVLAEYFKKNKLNTRSILFVAFTAEEMGLVGSNYFGNTISPESIVAGINIEMIGKESPFGANTAWLTGFERSTFGKIIQKNLSSSKFKLYPDPYKDYNLFFRSDNASLARLGIPSHTFSTSPMDKDLDYHKVSDEPNTLNIQTITQTISAIAKGTESIISGKDTPTRIQL